MATTKIVLDIAVSCGLAVMITGEGHSRAGRQVLLTDHVLLHEDFSKGVDASYWIPFGATTNNPGANDSNAQVIATADGNTVISIQPVTLTMNQSAGPFAGLDHTKYLVFSRDTSDVQKPGSITTWSFTLTTTLSIGQPPFPKPLMNDPQQDMRLLAAGGNFASLAECLVADFWLTKTALYALYERLPFCNGWNATNKVYHAFTAVKKVLSITPGQQVTVSIAYSEPDRNIVFKVQGVEGVAAVVNTPGVMSEAAAPGFKTIIDHAGTDAPMWPASVQAGFGFVNVLDAADPVTPVTLPNGQPLPSGKPEDPNGKLEGLVQLNAVPWFYADRMKFYDAQSRLSNRLWGQAGSATFYDLTVTQQA